MGDIEMRLPIEEIVCAWLQKNGYDGLYNNVGECACLVDDLAPCGHLNTEDCEPGYRINCDCGDHDFHIIGGDK